MIKTHILGTINIEAVSNIKIYLNTGKKDCKFYDSIISTVLYIFEILTRVKYNSMSNFLKHT